MAGDHEGASPVDQQDKLARFEQCIMPHMDAAYNLARWLSGNHEDAQDVVQDAYLRAYKFFEGFRGGDGRAWLLRIVRNAFYDWLRHNRRDETVTASEETVERAPDRSAGPDAALLQKADSEMLRQAIEALPLDFREILVMRELEEFSYKEIADIADVPLGTVMSRLARAREQLRQYLVKHLQEK